MKEETKKMWKAIGTLVLGTLIILAIPIMSWMFYGKFTYNLPGVMQEYIEEERMQQDQEDYNRVKEYCEFNVVGSRYGYSCDRPCIKHSLDDKNCVPKGCVGGGLFSRMECDLYVCEGYGDIIPQCLEYYHGTKEQYCKDNPDDPGWYCDRYS